MIPNPHAKVGGDRCRESASRVMIRNVCGHGRERGVTPTQSKDPPTISPKETQEAWKDHRMHTFKDYLVYKNNFDVIHSNLSVRSRHIDIFITSISVPGLVRQILFDDVLVHLWH